MTVNTSTSTTNSNGVAVDQQLRKEIATEVNVSVLRRMDSKFRHVVQTASHAALYKWQGTEWVRCDVDGATFLYERAPDVTASNDTKYRILCINRRSPENFSHDVLRCSPNDIEVVSNNTMITFPAKNGGIFGMWFYVPDELPPFYNTLCAVAQGKTVPALPNSTSHVSAVEKSSKNGVVQSRGRKNESPRRKARVSPKNDSSTGSTSATTRTVQPVHNERVSPPKDNSLQRFFPNLQPTTNGVIGSAVPVPAHNASVMEKTGQLTQTNGSSNGVRVAENVVEASELEKSTALSPTRDNNVRTTGSNGQPTSSSLMDLIRPASSPPNRNRSVLPHPVVAATASIPIAIPPGLVGQSSNSIGQFHPSPMSPPNSSVLHLPQSSRVQGIPTLLPGVLPGVHPPHVQVAHAHQQQAHMALLAHTHMQQHQQRHLQAPLLHPHRIFPNQLQDTRPVTMGAANGAHQHGIPNIRAYEVPSIGALPNGIGSGNGNRVSIDGNAGNAILGMLKPEAVPKTETRVWNSNRVSSNTEVQNVARSIAKMELRPGVMSKKQFRETLQKMASDQKLFESAYKTYRNTCVQSKKSASE